LQANPEQPVHLVQHHLLRQAENQQDLEIIMAQLDHPQVQEVHQHFLLLQVVQLTIRRRNRNALVGYPLEVAEGERGRAQMALQLWMLCVMEPDQASQVLPKDKERGGLALERQQELKMDVEEGEEVCSEVEDIEVVGSQIQTSEVVLKVVEVVFGPEFH
jgi:hypothetical protein